MARRRDYLGRDELDRLIDSGTGSVDRLSGLVRDGLRTVGKVDMLGNININGTVRGRLDGYGTVKDGTFAIGFADPFRGGLLRR